MSTDYSNDTLQDMFIFETTQLIQQLEVSILSCEELSCYTQSSINEIFRIMHTIKGSATMMMFDSISSLAHAVEDLFYFLREKNPKNVDCSKLSDLVLESIDFIKAEVERLKNGNTINEDVHVLINNIIFFLDLLKKSNESLESAVGEEHKSEKKRHLISRKKVKSPDNGNVFKAVVFFEEGCEMENIRAYGIIHDLEGLADEMHYIPGDIIENDESADIIRKEGFKVYLQADCSYEKVYELINDALFLEKLELIQIENDDEFKLSQYDTQGSMNAGEQEIGNSDGGVTDNGGIKPIASQQSIISVNVSKLDKLMDLVGEMVIAEAMVVQNPDIKELQLENFQKSARLLSKITGEIQDMVMSIRMVPLSTSFHKMQRIVRDMCKKLGKEAKLKIVGEETEVDKNIIEHISDPLMHLVRNALDHGIETSKDRIAANKQQTATVTLEAMNAGSDVLIAVKDDGKGLNREKILEKARVNKLLYKPESDMSDREIFNMIFLPGFSTKDDVSEFSGRGVGMDVVTKNIETVGGSVSVDSTPDKGTIVTMKIPLTLAIIDGMNIKVGGSCYTIPTTSIRESFKPKGNDIITDPDGNEMIMVRGQCYPVIRLHEKFEVMTKIIDLVEGILVMVEAEEKNFCIFADELLGQQQVVVKTLPSYIKNIKKIKGVAGCTLLGDGSISLIIDINNMISLNQSGR